MFCNDKSITFASELRNKVITTIKVTAMTLTTNDYYEIASQIKDGSNSIEFEKDGETLFIECALESDGYVEDDYYNGTGAYVETFRALYFESVESYNEDGEQTANNFDEATLQEVA